MLLFEEEHGSLLAVMDATAITAIRTAAVSGLATRLLARPDAGDLAILGAGTQGLTHLEAMLLVRPVRRVRLWSRTRARAETLAGSAGRRFGVEIEVMDEVQSALEGADLICTTTAAREPIVEAGWISPGAHLNVVGSSIPSHREVDSATVQRSQVFVDCRVSALAEPGDLLIPMKEGVIDAEHIGPELGDLILGKAPGRRSDRDITLFKSQGIAVEDVASARYLYEVAKRTGLGTEVHLGGTAHSEL